MQGRTTIRTLADLAGVSNATVSLALRDDPRIRPGERARIQQIAVEAGYKPNPVVAALLAQLRSSNKAAAQSALGLLYLGKTPHLLESVPTFRDWISGCQARANSLGYGLDRFLGCDPEMSPEHLNRVLYTRAIRGLVLMGGSENNILAPELHPIWQRSAPVVIGYRPSHPALSFVSNDQFSTTTQAMDKVVRLGYQRPGLCLKPPVDDAVENRFSGGFSVGQCKLAPKNRLPTFQFFDVRDSQVDPEAEQGFRSWFKRHRPDVILTLHWEVERWMANLRLRTPEDIGLVHLDKPPDLKWTGMVQNNESVGRAAVDMVIGQLHRNEFGVPPFQKCVLVGSTWVHGPTTRQ